MRTVAVTESTNADMLLLAAAGEAEGGWLRADSQTGGRGRQGRHWASPPGNLYASTVVRLKAGDPPAATLAMVAAVALEEVVSRLLARGATPPRPLHELEARDAATAPAGRVVLKWPNDLLIDGAKLSGILLERSDDAVVIGMGVNLAHHPSSLYRPTTSLAEQGVSTTPESFLEDLAPAFAGWLGAWRGDLSVIVARWLERAHVVGTPLRAELPDGTRLRGTFAGLDRDCGLLLRLGEGDVRLVHAGDVFLV